ncbi:MAG: NAD-dependent epimerase/dehydratase family protein [Nanoarchaeota archaeon]|nr:NAD-dependent epimerase/dehydratase family protein [Nanoarchaeota archaeon]
MKILITGGAGFIGSHIADAYLRAGHDVVIADNFGTASEKNVPPRARLHRVDIRDLSLLRRVFEAERPDLVNHHAAIASVAHSLRDPTPTMDTNVMGTLNVAFLSSEFGVRKLLFASTGGVIYGDPPRLDLPVSESYPRNPLSPYALSKVLAEDIIKFYASRGGFSFLVFRYANVYGPRQNPKGEAGVIAIFSELMREETRPTIFGDGSKTRDYVYVDDIVSANLLALERGENEVLNIGLGKEITDDRVFQLVADEIEYKGNPNYAPFREGENLRISLDASRAEKILGWKPKISLEEGVRRTLRVKS